MEKPPHAWDTEEEAQRPQLGAGRPALLCVLVHGSHVCGAGSAGTAGM